MKFVYYVLYLLFFALVPPAFCSPNAPLVHSVNERVPPKGAKTHADGSALRTQKAGEARLTSSVTIPIKAHIVRQSNGAGGLSQSTLQAAIATLNAKFQSSTIQFVLCNVVHYLDSDTFYNFDLDTENGQLVLNNVNDAINIYFVNSISAAADYQGGVSSFPCGLASENRIVLANTNVSNGSSLAHEVGHYFGLFHTFETRCGYEFVNGSNCQTTGDLVCDTPADKFITPTPLNGCVYNSPDVDANGQAYTPLTNNLMSYYGTCRTQFTAGQIARLNAGFSDRQSKMQALGQYVFNYPLAVVSAPHNLSVGSGSGSGSCGVYISWIPYDTSTNPPTPITNANGYIVERSTNPTSGFVAIGATTANNNPVLVDPYPLPGVQVYYRVVAANSLATPSQAVPYVEQYAPCYSPPERSDCSASDYISNFTLKSSLEPLINNTSTCGSNGSNGYTAYSTTATLTTGSTYTVTVTNPGQYPEDVTVWIDLNKDNIFTTNEIVYSISPTVPQNVQGGIFLLTENATSGQTRIRVRQSRHLTGIATCSIECRTYPSAETEDYTISILPSGLASASSGDWTNLTTWSEHRTPTTNDEVTIHQTHIVTLPSGTTGKGKKLKLQGRLVLQGTGKLQLGQ